MGVLKDHIGAREHYAARYQVIVEYPVVAPLPLKDHEKVRVTIESVEN